MNDDYTKVFLNGDYLPLSEAKISVLDRGFLFGDGIYEVIPAYNGKLFHFEAHLQRLYNSLADIGMQSPYNHPQWLELLQPLLVTGQDQYIYLQITRGVSPNRDHAFPVQTQPTVFAMCSPIKHPANKSAGFKAVTFDDTRWQMCNIKATTLLGNVLLRQKAVEQDCTEAILVKDGIVTEGAASNLFAVFDQVLVTPPKDNRILPGITRDLILEIAEQHDIATVEKEITLEALKNADEIWLTSSTREILPVVELDGKMISEGQAGPLWQTMQSLFQNYKQSLT